MSATEVRPEELVAGRELAELDAAVARAVLGLPVLGLALCEEWHDGAGWHVAPRQDEGTLRPVYVRVCGCEDNLPCQGKVLVFGHLWTCLEVVEPLSADIAAAFEVLAHIRAEWGRDAAVRFCAELQRIAGDYGWPDVMVEKLDAAGVAGAICRAALAALEAP